MPFRCPGYGWDCLGRKVVCPRPSYFATCTGVLLGGFTLWLLIISYLSVSALITLGKLPYVQYRISNLILRLQVSPFR